MDSYRFEDDQEWITYRENLMIPVGMDETAVLNKYKRKWYQAKFGVRADGWRLAHARSWSDA